MNRPGASNETNADDAASVIISGSMSTSEILSRLNRHGCPEITAQLDLSKFSRAAVSTGGFGDVYRGALRDGTRVGAKCLRLLIGADDDDGRKQLKRAARELYVWSKCKHPNILELVGVAQYDERVAMVSPWMENGNLTWYLSRHPEADRYSLCAQVADATAFLKTYGVVHGDIKGANILVSRDGVPKLADFGTSAINNYTLNFTTTTTSPQMTLRWTAPEIFLGETKHTFEGDTILEVFTGSVPYKGLLDVAVMKSLMERVPPTRPEKHIPVGVRHYDLLWALITSCWEIRPQNRPLAQQVRDELKSIMKIQTQVNVSIDMSPREVFQCIVNHGSHDLTDEIEPGGVFWGRARIGYDSGLTELRDGTEVNVRRATQSAHYDIPGETRTSHTELVIAQEAYILSQCNHPHIEKIIGVTMIDDRIAIVSPELPSGCRNSWQLLPILDPARRRKMSIQIADAIAYLHSKDIVHGKINLRSINVLPDWTVQLRDFNYALSKNSTLSFPKFPVRQWSTTEWWSAIDLDIPTMAPELCGPEPKANLTFETDVYALGIIIMAVMIEGPYKSWEDLRKRLETQLRTNSTRGDRLWSLLEECCAQLPEGRPLAIDVRDKLITFDGGVETN